MINVGDTVQKRSGELFSDGTTVSKVTKNEGNGIVWLETECWCHADILEHANLEAKSPEKEIGYHDLPDHVSKLLMHDLLIKRHAVIRCWGFNIRLEINKAGQVTGHLEDTSG